MTKNPYAQNISEEDRESIVKEFMPKIRSWVIRISSTLPSSVDTDDLYSAACMGLVESMQRFDKSRNVDFRVYAERRIKGSMLDALRQMDFLPRNLRSKIKELESMISFLGSKLGRKPSVDDIVQNSEWSEDDVYKLMNAMENGQVTSLDANVDDEGESNLIDFIKSADLNPSESFEKTRLVEVLADAIDSLPEKEKLAVTLYYYEELTMKEIGDVMGITESRVSQIHSSAVSKLKKKLREWA